MMSSERELLEHCRMYLSSLGMFYEHGKLINNIDELLAQPEQSSTTRHALDSYWNQEAYQRGYAQAELDLKREPFGPEERQRLSKAYSTRAEQVAFEEGIIFAEISYGIGGE